MRFCCQTGEKVVRMKTVCREAREKKMLSIIETSGKEIPRNLESCYQSRGGREVVVIVLLS